MVKLFLISALITGQFQLREYPNGFESVDECVTAATEMATRVVRRPEVQYETFACVPPEKYDSFLEKFGLKKA